MASDYFEFKQFRVYHRYCGMKVGTDAVVLGAIVPLNLIERNILDIGTGSGILALMLAQRTTTAKIDAIEIDEAACSEAAFNFSQSPWQDRLLAYANSLQNYSSSCKQTYDLIISNPPYFVSGKNISIENEQRSKARQDADLPFPALVQQVKFLLKPEGTFWLILPEEEGQIFKQIAEENKLFLFHQINVYPKPGRPVKRVIMGFKKSKEIVAQSSFTIYQEDGKPSSEYIQASKDFYLRIDQ